jgi:hypothetical protein
MSMISEKQKFLSMICVCPSKNALETFHERLALHFSTNKRSNNCLFSDNVTHEQHFPTKRPVQQTHAFYIVDFYDHIKRQTQPLHVLKRAALYLLRNMRGFLSHDSISRWTNITSCPFCASQYETVSDHDCTAIQNHTLLPRTILLHILAATNSSKTLSKVP